MSKAELVGMPERSQLRWWGELPPNELVRGLIVANIQRDPLSPDLSIAEKRVQALTRNTAATQQIVDFINQHSDQFIGSRNLRRINAFGVVGLSLFPPHCDLLMESGVVSEIIQGTLADEDMVLLSIILSG